MRNPHRFLQHGAATQKRRAGNAYVVVEGRYVPIQVSGTEKDIARQVAEAVKRHGVDRSAVQTNVDGQIHVGVMPIT